MNKTVNQTLLKSYRLN